MDFGGLHLEDRRIRFAIGGKSHLIPYKNLVWAYHKEDVQSTFNGIVLHTWQKEQYQIEMSREEAERCLEALKKQKPELITGDFKGGKLSLISLDNTQDLGAIQTEDGRRILPGRLLRSGDLYHVSYADQNYLRRDYRLKKVIDFRTGKEQSKRPDVVLDGVDYINNPIIEEKFINVILQKDMMEQIAHFPGDGEDYMFQLYENLVLNPRAQSAYGDFLRILKHHGEGAVLWHSAAGKDRAGVGTALLLRILGVSQREILENYVQTELCLQKDIKFMLLMLEHRGVPRRALRNAEIMLGVKKAYLQRAFEKIEEKYGTFDKYVKKALGLTVFDMNFLKDRYLF